MGLEYFFKQYLILDAHAIHHQIANRQRIEEPTAHRATSQFVCILDIVAILSALFILNDETKHLFDSNAPFMECSDRKGIALTHVVVHPTTVDLFERDLLSFIDGFHQPNILIYCILCHTLLLLMVQRYKKPMQKRCIGLEKITILFWRTMKSKY